MSRRVCSLMALAGLVVAPLSARAALVTYKVDATLTANTMTSGAFVGAPLGAPVVLRFTVDTSVAPTFSSSTYNFWDGAVGLITDLKAKVLGVASSVTPAPPAHARVVNDALASGGTSYYDQFWMEMESSGPAPDFTLAQLSLGSIAPTPPVPSSLVGIDFPTSSSELVVSSFTTTPNIRLRGQSPAENIFAVPYNVTVLVPAPAGVVALSPLAGLMLARRRRRG